jgi:ribosomal protein S18 acetylase RimI-like enzyme
MNILIESVTPADIETLVAMLHEFAEFENLSEYCEVTVEKLNTAMFGDGSFVRALIARDGNDAIGYAIYYPSFASFSGQRSMYLEDLYVKEPYRGHGLGERLLSRVAKDAAASGADRLDFMVLDWNEPAVKFYKKLGAGVNDDERHYKFQGDAFWKLANRK